MEEEIKLLLDVENAVGNTPLLLVQQPAQKKLHTKSCQSRIAFSGRNHLMNEQ
jgi:hypothetical protein